MLTGIMQNNQGGIAVKYIVPYSLTDCRGFFDFNGKFPDFPGKSDRCRNREYEKEKIL